MSKTIYQGKPRVAALIPAYNEARVIAKTLKALGKLVAKEDIYVVDDGSSDNTKKIARKFTGNVLVCKNHGKAHALNSGIKHFGLTKKYEYIFFMDADTEPRHDFLERAMKHFEEDPDQKIVCVIGRVKGYPINWVSKYRQWEYHISHLIHKKAQENLGSILVVPGCATVYRSFIFDILSFPSGTLTEDMDFTFLMHRSGYHKMVLEEKAVVYTQDPLNLKDFTKQCKRWYTGFWQVVRKHDVPWGGQVLDFEVAVLAIEGLYNGMIVLFFLLSIFPLALMGAISLFRIPLLVDLLIFFIPTLVWSAVVDKDYIRILYIPHFYFLRLLSSTIFLKSFFNGFLSTEQEYVWDSNRYFIEGKEA